jgi:acyl-CoA thioesterase
MNATKEFFLKDSFGKECGVILLEASPGKARVKMEITEKHLNSHGTVHGGAIFTLADTAFAVASNSHGIPAAAINSHISYVKSVTSGTLYAAAEEISLNPKIATYLVSVTDESDENIATFQGMVYRKTPKKK